MQKQNITTNLTLIRSTFSAFSKFLRVKYAFITVQHIYLYIILFVQLMGYFIAVCVADTYSRRIAHPKQTTTTKKVCHYLPSSHSKSLRCYFSCGKQKSSLKAVEWRQQISPQIM